MGSLYIVAAQPNPPGRDAYHGHVANDQVNREWLEFEALQDRDLVGDTLHDLTFDSYCGRTGAHELVRFTSLKLRPGQHVRVHTGRGTNYWDGTTYHWYLGRSWYVWNNACGDRATLSYDGSVIDSAYYEPSPPEGLLLRVQGTDRLVPSRQVSHSWR